MSLPLATTTVTVTAQAEAEPGDGLTASTRASGVRAAVVSPSGRDVPGPGGGAEVIDAVLLCDPVDGLAHSDLVTTAEGEAFEVRWVTQRIGFGLGHTKAGLVRLTGRAAA